MAEKISNQIDSIIVALNSISSHLDQIQSLLSSQHFWDSKWFSALIGAGTAIFVFILEKSISKRKEEDKQLLEFCKWLNEQWTFRAPDALLDAARSMTYGHVEKNLNTGEERIFPEKPLGEKMVIELRRDLKWWREANRELTKMFREYEKRLKDFDALTDVDKEEEARLIERANKQYEKIDKYAFKVTGDNEYTYI